VCSAHAPRDRNGLAWRLERARRPNLECSLFWQRHLTVTHFSQHHDPGRHFSCRLQRCPALCSSIDVLSARGPTAGMRKTDSAVMSLLSFHRLLEHSLARAGSLLRCQQLLTSTQERGVQYLVCGGRHGGTFEREGADENVAKFSIFYPLPPHNLCEMCWVVAGSVCACVCVCVCVCVYTCVRVCG